jgi:hypothetical protein
MNLKEFKDEVSKSMYKMSAKEAREQGVCIQCKEKALPKCYSEAGRKEYTISGLCEVCFDNMFT